MPRIYSSVLQISLIFLLSPVSAKKSWHLSLLPQPLRTLLLLFLYLMPMLNIKEVLYLVMFFESSVLFLSQMTEPVAFTLQNHLLPSSIWCLPHSLKLHLLRLQ